jgi:predicted TIM-barrel fold metal-dependent hydrolase
MAAKMIEPPIFDCQCHLFTPGTLARLRVRQADPCLVPDGETDVVVMGAWRRRISRAHTDINGLLATMDEAGVSRIALSPNDPGPEWFEADGGDVAAESNAFIAATVNRFPERLIGLGVLPLPDIRQTLREMDRGVMDLGLKGFLLYSNIRGQYPDAPEFDGVFKKAANLEVPLFIHPAKPVWDQPMADIEMIAAVSNMFEDTVALLRLILSGVLDRHPTLRLVCPHLGGTLPYVLGRLEHQMTILKRGPRDLALTPLEYLRRIYFDIVSPQPSAMRLLIELVGTERLLFGSDYPWVRPGVILDALRSLELEPAENKAILHGNAETLFQLKTNLR